MRVGGVGGWSLHGVHGEVAQSARKVFVVGVVGVALDTLTLDVTSCRISTWSVGEVGCLVDAS